MPEANREQGRPQKIIQLAEQAENRALDPPTVEKPIKEIIKDDQTLIEENLEDELVDQQHSMSCSDWVKVRTLILPSNVRMVRHKYSLELYGQAQRVWSYFQMQYSLIRRRGEDQYIWTA